MKAQTFISRHRRTMARAVHVVALGCLLGAFGASAQPTKGGAGGNTTEGAEAGQHRGPPPEALAACKSLVSGAECGFTAPRGNVKGTCWAPEGRPLACRPKDAPQGGQGQKPQARQ
ncbi:MAG: hypothetical protein H7346_16340 [Burkholderiaceae bacterium]|nr:hypothetical protein [Burkholderiaceae bacterium]